MSNISINYSYFEEYIFISNVLASVGAKTLDVWHELCDQKYFAQLGGHFNSLGYEKLSKLLEADFQKHFK